MALVQTVGGLRGHKARLVSHYVDPTTQIGSIIDYDDKGILWEYESGIRCFFPWTSVESIEFGVE